VNGGPNAAVAGGVNLPAVTVALSQVAVLVVLSPLLIGLMRTVRARLEGRVGGGLR
jgi:formate hydrogenlyase subunit 4